LRERAAIRRKALIYAPRKRVFFSTTRQDASGTKRVAILILLNQKKIVIITIIFHLAQTTSLLWIWHLCTDTYHHPKMSQTRQERPVDAEEEDNCPICAQLLGTLGSCVIEAEIDLPHLDMTFYDVCSPHFFYISQFSSQPFSARPPPVC